jgi:hypothetical protein
LVPVWVPVWARVLVLALVRVLALVLSATFHRRGCPLFLSREQRNRGVCYGTG